MNKAEQALWTLIGSLETVVEHEKIPLIVNLHIRQAVSRARKTIEPDRGFTRPLSEDEVDREIDRILGDLGF